MQPDEYDQCRSRDPKTQRNEEERRDSNLRRVSAEKDGGSTAARQGKAAFLAGADLEGLADTVLQVIVDPVRQELAVVVARLRHHKERHGLSGERGGGSTRKGTVSAERGGGSTRAEGSVFVSPVARRFRSGRPQLQHHHQRHQSLAEWERGRKERRCLSPSPPSNSSIGVCFTHGPLGASGAKCRRPEAPAVPDPTSPAAVTNVTTAGPCSRFHPPSFLPKSSCCRPSAWRPHGGAEF